MESFLIGCIVGVISGVIIGAWISPDTINKVTNKIGKIKRNATPVSLIQQGYIKPSKKKVKKVGIFRKIFKKRKNE